MPFAIKAEFEDRDASRFDVSQAKTMYGGRRIAQGDTVFLFASGGTGATGLFARGVVVRAEAVPRRPGIARQTPRVSVAILPVSKALRPLGRADLTGFTDWADGRPETELNFKLYRQATDKIVGLSEEAAAFLATFFPAPVHGAGG